MTVYNCIFAFNFKSNEIKFDSFNKLKLKGTRN